MILIQVHMGEGKVVLDHIQGGMPQHHLKRIGITTIAQVIDGEGVAKAVDIDTKNASSVADGDQDAQQAGDDNGVPAGKREESYR